MNCKIFCIKYSTFSDVCPTFFLTLWFGIIHCFIEMTNEYSTESIQEMVTVLSGQYGNSDVSFNVCCQ